MKKIQTFIYVLLMGFAFAACQDDSLGGTEQGGIRIALTDGTAGVDVTTRSTPSELFDGFKQKFKFQIKGDNYDQTHEWTKDVIPLAAGVYDITATCGTEQADGVVEFDKPCYTGTKEGLKVNAGETATTAEISCKVTNALVSIQFDDEYKEYITDATYAMIAVESGTETNWADLSTSAYFKAGSSITQLKLYKDGTESTYADILAEAKKNSNFPETFAAGDHLILTLSIAKANGNAAIKVSKVEVQKVPISETIPLEWLPKPKVEADGFTNNALTFVETETPPAKLNLDLASALQDIKFKFDFEDEQFSFEDREYLLSTDKARIEEALGITLPAIGATNASIDFSGLVAKLQSKVDGATTNKIMIVPKANDRWSSEKTDVDSVYTFTCNKPEFSIAVQEGNVWTKTFTIDEPTVTAGDAETIKSKLKYQYKTENGEWQDCEQLVQFDSAPDEKNYQVRAIYRDAIASEEVAVTLETPAQLPNSDMEEWSYTESSSNNDGNEGSIFNSKYNYIPIYNLGTTWCTNNTYTTRYDSKTFGRPYNCFPAVSYVPGRNEYGWAAELRNTAAGRGNTKAIGHTELDLNKVAGELFLGDIEVIQGGTDAIPDGDHYVIQKGKDFTSRPSALSFWYKYSPCNSDTWKVTIELLDENKEVIISKTHQSSEAKSEYTEVTVPLDYQESVLYEKCKYIYIVFSSTINVGSSLQYNTVDYTLWKDNNQQTFKHTYVGSVLTIDDIQLIYDK